MIKNFIRSLFIFSLCMIGANVSAHDIEVPNADGVTIYYNYINDSTELAVTFAGDWYGYRNNEYSGVVVIPEEVTFDGHTLKVTLINNSAFSYCHELTSVTIPNSVTDIGNHTFNECYNLVSVNIPDDVTSIGTFTFGGCSSLTSVTIPNSVTTIGESAFDCCQALTSISIPNSVNKIGSSAFYLCNSLTSFHIPDSVTSIEDYVFAGCHKLTSITMGNKVEDIGNYAFAACQSLTSVTIPDNVKSISDFAFHKCYSLTSIDIGNGVTSIGNYAFSECTFLSTVTIGESVAKIGECAFYNCQNLQDVYCYTVQVPESKLTFSNHTNATLHVPAASVGAYQAIWQWKDFKEIVALPAQEDYRPFIENDKVWTVKVISDWWPTEEWFEYYYFDGDTIVNGQSAKRMLCDRIDSSQDKSGEYIGAWFEQNKKVYYATAGKQQFELLYDFTLSTGDNIYNQDGILQVTKMSGSIQGFKGTYYDLLYSYDTNIVDRWLEGIGSESYPWLNLRGKWAGNKGDLLVCRVGDEIIYYNSEEEDPYSMGAKKHRFDFTHTVKNQPKAPRRSREALSLYGEYNDLRLGINLVPLGDAYQVRITDESGKVVYEKAVNAGSVVALDIDISAFAKGRYTVTVENSSESFYGEFDTQTTGIKEVNSNVTRTVQYYSIDGKRISTLQRGLNIVRTNDGKMKKVVVKK